MNEKIIKGFVGVAVAAAVLYGVYFVSRPQVGVINFAKVRTTAKAYVALAEQQSKYEEDIQALIMKDKDFIRLQEEGEELTKQQKSLPKSEFERRSAVLHAKAVKINERYQDSFVRNARAAEIAVKSIEQQIAEAIEATSQRTGARILLPVNTILYASEKADLSDVFVEELDKRVQNVDYPNPATLDLQLQ